MRTGLRVEMKRRRWMARFAAPGFEGRWYCSTAWFLGASEAEESESGLDKCKLERPKLERLHDHREIFEVETLSKVVFLQLLFQLPRRKRQEVPETPTMQRKRHSTERKNGSNISSRSDGHEENILDENFFLRSLDHSLPSSALPLDPRSHFSCSSSS